MAKVISKIKPLLIAVQVVAAVLFLISPVFASVLNSTNYQITDFNFGQGGEADGSSANYKLNSNVELVIDAQQTAPPIPPTPPPGEPPAPPPPPPPQDTTPPIISNVRAISITTSTAIIAWDTDEAADSFAEYGVSTAYGTIKTNPTLTTTHGLYISGLISGTLYHFRVKSADASNNQATSGDYTFTTLTVPLPDITPPAISNIRVINITGTTARILWDTNEPATSLVNYGLNNAYGSAALNPTFTVAHQIDLVGLSPDTDYHFQVVSTDASGNTGSSGDQIFRTLDTIPPTISNIQVINITERSADITWVTNEAATSQIYYRRVGETAYSVAASNVLQVSHFMSLQNLIGNTQYEFYIVATDAAGNSSTSASSTFATLPDNIPPSNIRNFIATPDDGINVLTWQNPADPDYAGVYIVRSQVTYPRNRFEGAVVYVGPGVSVTDTGLTNGITYYYTGFAYDTSNNFASGAITQGTPVGPTPPVIPVVPPPVIPVVPPTINLGAATFWVANRTIQIYPDINNILETLAGKNLGISLDVNAVSSAVKLVTLRIDDSNYLFKLRADGSAYDTDIALPPSTGKFEAEIALIFENEQQILKFSLDLKPDGMIYEIKNGAVQPVEDAIVTLYELSAGGWRIWSGGPYYQINPAITRSGGLYGFLVPDGTYYLKVEKDGYHSVETNRFDVTRNYVNQSLELLLTPKKLLEVIEPEAPFVQNVVAVSKNLFDKAIYGGKIARGTVIDAVQNPLVEQATENVAAPGLAAIAFANIFTAVPLFNLWTYLQYLLSQPLLFFARKKRKAWGAVYNAFTKLPLDLAIVRLLDAKTKRVIRTVVTDKQGRYVLFAPQGEYILTVTKPGFQFPSAYLKGRKEDEAYVDLYFGEKFAVKQDGQAVAYNIPMDPIDKKVSLRGLIVSRALKGMQFGLSLAGVVLTAVSLIIIPSVTMALFLALHIALFVLFLRLARPAKFAKWGSVRDAATGKPIKNAVVRLFEPEYNKLLGTQITDGQGRYAFLVGRNIYYLTFEKAGYKTLRTKNLDMRTRAKEAIIAEKAKMENIKFEARNTKSETNKENSKS